MPRTLIKAIAVIGLITAPRLAIGQTADQDAVLATVRTFHDALVRGDSAAALKELAADVQILESGDLENLDHYRNHHLAADMAFARAVSNKRTEPSVVVSGDVAWVVGTSRTTGIFRERTINTADAELMVLSRTTEGWSIRAIHWSSRNIRTP